jgi:hypothetical protein
MANDGEVGYGKPPKQNQWKKGRSGNPKGRPKGVKNLGTVVQEEAYSKIVIKEGGQTRTVSKVEALMKAMMAKGIQGNTQAASIALSLLREYLPHGDPAGGDFKPPTDEELSILINHAKFLEVMEGATDDEADT